MNKIISIDFNRAAKEMSSSEVFSNELIVSNLHDRKTQSERLENMPTIRLDAITLFICLHGSISFHIDYKDIHLEEMMLLQLNNIHLISNVRMSSNFEGYMIAISPKLGQYIMNDLHSIRKMTVGIERSLLSIKLSEIEENCLVEAIARLMKTMRNSEHSFQNFILKNETTIFLLEMANINYKRSQIKDFIGDTPISNKEEVTQKFINLVFTHCKEEHEVLFYANKLYMTSGNLSRILKQITGKTAIKWISDTLIIEAKVLLQNSSLSIQEISEQLHFGDLSSFGKFFKKHTESTPKEFRNKVEAR